MANSCTNIMYCETSNTENLQKIKAFITSEFHCDNIDEDEQYIEFNFDTSWKYPKESMDKLMASLMPDNELYMRVLSHELSNEYVSFRVYRFGAWDC